MAPILKLKHSSFSFIWMTIIGFATGCIIGASLHEGGHALVALSYSRQIQEIRIGPFIKIYPKIEIVSVSYDLGEVLHDSPQTPQEEGLREIAGSGLTAIVALFGIILLRWLPLSRRSKLAICAANLVFAWDIISYSIFPRIGLRHWIIAGGVYAEPLRGALLLGMTESTYYISLAAYTGIIHWLAFVQLQRTIKD